MNLKQAPIGLSALMLLCACGGPPGEASAPVREAASEAGMPYGTANAFSFEQTGAVMSRAVPDASELTLSGGCDGTTPISLSLFAGEPIDDSWFNVAFDTEAVVAPGETGVFPLVEMDWDNGVTRPDNLPADTAVRVPVRNSGKGTLTLETHNASTNNRRMIGVLEGSLQQDGESPAVNVTARFDVNLSCGVK